MIIDAIDLFTDIRKNVEMDRQLAKDYGIVFVELPQFPEIIIHGKAYAFLPERE